TSGLPIGGAQADDERMPAVHKVKGDALLLEDWLYQAGKTLDPTDISNEIRWTRLIAERYSGNTADQVQPDLKRLSNCAATFKTFSSATPAKEIQKLYLAIRRIKRRILLADPALDFDGLLFIDNQYPIASKLPENRDKRESQLYRAEWNHQSQHRGGYNAVPGGRLLHLKGLHPGAEIEQLAPTPDQSEGAFLRPDLSFDGTKVLFSFKPAKDNSYHLYEIGIDGSGLKQLTDSVYDDNDPIYLPDGHIMFTTTRGNTTVRCTRYSWSTVLARCDADGKNVYILSRNNEPDWLPSLLSDGRVVYTRWEYTEKNVMRIQGLWTVYPDGTKVDVLWGNMSVWPDHLASPRQIPGTSQIMFSGVGHHRWHNGSVGIVDPAKGREYPDGLTKVTPDVAFAESGDGPGKLPLASKTYHSSGKWGSYKNPYPLSKDLFLVSIHKGAINKAKSKQLPLTEYFQLYLMDTDGNRELVYKGKYNIFHAIPVKPRKRPTVRPSSVKWPGTGKDRKPNAPGYFFSSNVYEGTTIPKGSAKHLRVIQLDYKTYTPWRQIFGGAGPNRIPLPSATYPSASSKRILGTVPINKEGAFYIEAPAGTSLMFQLLDDQYRCIQTMRSFTGVMPGETRGCVGCHEQRPNAPVNLTRLRKTPDKILPPPWGTTNFSYERMIQPIFNKHCLKCHGDNTKKAFRKLDLRLTKNPERGNYGRDFSNVYMTLIGPGQYRKGKMKLKNYTGAVDISAGTRAWKTQQYSRPFKPMTFFSFNSLLLKIITTDKKNHKDLKLDADELRMLTAWMDLNCPYRGDDELRQLPDPQFAGVEKIVPRPRIKTAPIIPRP
ncbi:MAG: hypothetical protein HN350_20560, partial [Phycisphaerales bacterium]|nr:hypothetical protein [Phycisphaerales bacterium]